MAIERWIPGRGLSRGPAATFGRLEREMEDLFSRLTRTLSTPRKFAERVGIAPAVDMLDRKDEVVLRADLPGLEQKDITLSVDDGVLTIRGERKAEQQTTEDDYYCCERWAGSFERSIPLPTSVDPDKIRATFRAGVLEVHLPKAEKAKGKTIEIKAA